MLTLTLALVVMAVSATEPQAEARPANPPAAAETTSQPQVTEQGEKPAAPVASAPAPAPAPSAPKAKERPYTQLEAGPVLLTVNAEVRGRFEYRDTFNFDNRVQTQRSYDFLRTRFGLRADWSFVSAMVEGFDTQEFVTPKASRTQYNPLDLHQAFVELKKPLGVPVSVKVGRQELNYGARLLVASPTWSNNVRVWDLAKATVDLQGWKADVFLGKVVAINTAAVDSWKAGENFFGAYVTKQAQPWLTVEAYFLGLHDQPYADPAKPITSERGTIGSATRLTPGLRGYGTLLDKKVDFEVEGATQFGNRADDTIRAFMAHAAVGYKTALTATPSVRAEYNYASGDGAKTDGIARTFSPLFGTTHDPYGMMDLFRLQNMHDLGVMATAKPLPTLSAAFEYHSFWLADSRDNWVDSSGNTLRKGTAQTGSRWVGHELDFKLTVAPVSQIKVEGGAGVFLPETFVRRTGRADPATWFYLQLIAAL